RRGVDLMHLENNVFVPRKGEPVVTLAMDSAGHAEKSWIGDVRVLKKGASYGELVRRVVSDLGWKGARVGLGDHVWGSTWLEVARAVKGAGFQSAEAFMDHLRMIKDPGEIEILRRAAMLTDEVMERVVSDLEGGVTQGELGLYIEMMGRKSSASDISFPPTGGFVKTGSKVSDQPFIYPADEGLSAGTSIAFDVGFVVDGYCSDWGRSVYYGPAGDDVKNGYEALQRAVVETVDLLHEGSMRVCDVFRSIEGVLDREGYGDYLRARLPDGRVGHQIGIEVHEPPWLKPGNEHLLQAGMVMCLEPKLWRAGEYYLRVEDMVLIHKDRAEFLTNFNREFFQL
ncbi:MAG: aminopeptidase P family protein, partial [Candidatus Bathyarchaeota archaeon]